VLIRCYGVRGSVPTCDLRTWRYGGNTACVEVETPAGHRIILDGGTGLRRLGRTSAWGKRAGGGHAFWLLSHYHWDHIQGVPFFPPLFDPQHHFEFFGPAPQGGGTMEAALQGQMFQPYFPVDMSALKARRSFTEVASGQRWQMGDATVEAISLHHPQGCLGFRIETTTGTLAYATDTEPGNPAADAGVRQLAKDADVLFYDAQFSPERLGERPGWGHSSWAEAVRIARDAGIRCLILFHHDPEADDVTVDQYVRTARAEWPETWAAAEGLHVSCRTPGVYVERVVPRVGPRVPGRQAVRLRGRSLEGLPIELKGFMSNVTLKGSYLVVPEWSQLQPEIEVTLSGPNGHAPVMQGQVVRVDVDPETGQPAIGIVFSAEEQSARPPAGPKSSRRPRSG